MRDTGSEEMDAVKIDSLEMDEQSTDLKPGPPASPEASANPLSRLLFLWVFPLVFKGYRKPLEEDDVWQLNPNNSAEITAKLIEDVYVTLPKDKPRVVRSLWRVLRKQALKTMFLQAMILLMTLSTPLIINQVLLNVEDVTSSTKPGLLWSLGLFLVALARSLFESHFFVEAARGSTTIRSSIQLVVALALLYRFIGPSAFIAMAFTLITIPIQGNIVKRIFQLRRQAITTTDQRVKMTNEVLQGIKAVKFYAWEKPFLKSISEIRKRELSLLHKSVLLRSTFVVLVTALPTLVTVVTFTFYISVFKNPLVVNDLFTGLVLLNQLRQPLFVVPFAVTSLVESKVSIKRIERFLGFEDISPPPKNDERCEVGEVIVENGSFSWGGALPALPKKTIPRGMKERMATFAKKLRSGKRKEAASATEADQEQETPVENGDCKPELVLQDINVHFEQGQIIGVVGRVGSGKTSLICAILGELMTESGEVHRRGRTGYVPQTAWIYNGTVKDNILFGEPYDEARYQRAIEVAQLESDIAILPNGHQTMIGEKGVNLSGGQKQRVSIARTIYADLDIYLFDDPLSALDAHVGAHLYEKCLSNKGLLRKKTRVLVTHQLQILPEMDYIVVVADGRVQSQGTYQELVNKDANFNTLLGDIISEEKYQEEQSKYTAADSSTIAGPKPPKEGEKDDAKAKSSLVTKGAAMSVEERQTGSLGIGVYWTYAQRCGGVFLFGLTLALSAIGAGLQVLPNWWLSYWAEEDEFNPGARPSAFYLGIFYLLGIVYLILTFLRSLLYFTVALRAAKTMQFGALTSVLNAPMSFFDVTPIGRVLSRFGRDVESVDTQVPQQMIQMLNTLMSLIAAYVMISIILPIFMAVALPVAVIYYLLQRFYNRTNIELKRLDSISKSPIYAHFAETLGGLTTIRAFDRQDRYLEENVNHIDTNVRFYFAQILTGRWFSFYLEALGSLLILAVAMFAVHAKTTVFAGLVALALNYALQVTSFLGFTIRSITELESAMNSVERLAYYEHELPEEAAAIVEDNRPKDTWPSSGQMSFQDVKLRYREGMELALTGVTCEIAAGEKIGVVGRTGAGKSSLVAAILRIVELDSGTITIDGTDLSSIGLEDLRSKVTIIPQDPVVFSGTIRFNLDPFARYTDAELWDALDKANLKAFVSSIDGGLDSNVTEYGSNLSGGQQQLICLARAILRRPRVLIMDEATSNVDYETDQIVQKTIRSEFVNSTVITIAHRLWTIADYDRIMVIDSGKVIEFDSPQMLIPQENSHLTRLIESMGAAGANAFRNVVLNGATPDASVTPSGEVSLGKNDPTDT